MFSSLFLCTEQVVRDNCFQRDKILIILNPKLEDNLTQQFHVDIEKEGRESEAPLKQHQLEIPDWCYWLLFWIERKNAIKNQLDLTELLLTGKAALVKELEIEKLNRRDK